MDFQRSLIPLSLCFLTGLLAGLEVVPPVLAVLPILLIPVLFRIRLEVRERVVLGVLVLVFAGAGLVRGGMDSHSYQTALRLQGPFRGRLVVEEVRGEKGVVGKILGGEEVDGAGIRVLFYSEKERVPGEICRADGTLVLPQAAMNQGGFSYRDYLRNIGVYLVLEGASLEREGWMDTPASFLHRIRQEYLLRMEGILGEDLRWLKSTFLGDYGDLTEEEAGTWRKLGITHLLAVSGSQVGALFDLLLLVFVATPGKGRMKFLAFLPFPALYGFLTDTPSVWRAVFCFLILAFLRELRQEPREITALLLSALILLLAWPRYAFQISFQLSYGIALGVIAWRKTIQGAGGPLRKTLAAGGISVLFSLPLLLLYFQSLSLLTLAATPLIAPLVQLVILLAACSLFLPFLNEALPALNLLLIGSIRLMNQGVAWLDVLPEIRLTGGPWPVALILLYYLLLLLLSLPDFRRRWGKPLAVCVPIVVLSVFVAGRLPSGDLEAVFLNVGQGDSILLITPSPRKVILIDGGRAFGESDMGEREVLPALRRRNIRKIDLLISTHGDNDHMGGLNAVLEECEVAAVAVPPLEYDAEGDYAPWQQSYGGKLVQLEEGSRFTAGGVLFEVLGPERGLGKIDKNASSIVLGVSYGESSLLLTGDCGLEVLEELAEDGRRFDLVKAPHHGSASSWRKGIYEDLGAAAVVFSVGENRYGHPSPLILEDLEREGIGVRRTDREGTLAFRLSREKIFFGNPLFL